MTFGHLPLMSPHLQLYVERLQREGISPSRIHNTINPLRAIYRRALDLDDVPVNPV
jgi:hypothetical protein